MVVQGRRKSRPLLEQGVPLYEVSRILGHSSLATTANMYGHFSTEMQLRAAERMDALLAGA